MDLYFKILDDIHPVFFKENFSGLIMQTHQRKAPRLPIIILAITERTKKRWHLIFASRSFQELSR